MEGERKDLNSDNMSTALKLSAAVLNHPSLKGIRIDRVDTHSLRSVGANALSLAGYSNRDTQKWEDGEGGAFKGWRRFVSIRKIKRHTCQYIGWKEREKISILIT